MAEKILHFQNWSKVMNYLFCVLYEWTNIQGITDGALLDSENNQLVIAEVVFSPYTYVYMHIN